MIEIAKTIPGYPDYIIDIFGKVYSLHKGFPKLLKASKKDKRQYLYHWLYLKGKSRKWFYVHTLMSITFFETKPNTILVINHVDGNGDNNKLSNLELVSQSENVQHGWDTGLRQRHTKNTEAISWAEFRDI